MSDTGDSDQDDKALFRASVKGARRLRGQRPPPPRRRPPPKPRTPADAGPRPRDDLFAPDPAQVEVAGEEALLFARPGLQHGVLRKLRRGQFDISAELDLHGMTAAAAARALQEFLARSQRADTRCVRVIHGKGLNAPERAPVLKSRVNAWLRSHEGVLAFCSARPQDGGAGALYVLLRKRPA